MRRREGLLDQGKARFDLRRDFPGATAHNLKAAGPGNEELIAAGYAASFAFWNKWVRGAS